MKILITGGLGFVGKNLLRVLQENRFKMEEITVVDQEEDSGFCRKFGVQFIKADLAKEGEWQNVFKNQRTVIILHAQIASPEPSDFLLNNVKATENVIKAAQKYQVSKIIYFSSAAVLSLRKDFYAQTKKEAEEIIKKSGLSYVIIQPSIIYGPYDQKNIGWLINFARKCPIFPIPGHGKYPRQPIYVDDLCQIIVQLINRFPEENKIYSINGKEKIYFCEIVRVVLKELKGIHLMFYIPISIFLFLMRVYGIFLCSPFTPDQIKSLTTGETFPDYPWWEEFNIKPTLFKEGIKKMMRYKKDSKTGCSLLINILKQDLDEIKKHGTRPHL